MVTCSIKGSGPYAITANGSADGRGFSIQGTVGSDGNGTITSASFVSSAIGQLLQTKENCTIDAAPAAGETLRIAPGEMFAKIDCPYVWNSAVPDISHCQALSVLMVLKNCAK